MDWQLLAMIGVVGAIIAFLVLSYLVGNKLVGNSIFGKIADGIVKMVWLGIGFGILVAVLAGMYKEPAAFAPAEAAAFSTSMSKFVVKMTSQGKETSAQWAAPASKESSFA